MGREILFRGKHIHTFPQNEHFDGTWVYGYLSDKHYINAVGEDEYGDKFTSEVLVDPETVCQYTGLTDKNGRKIFEGDICKFSIFDYNGHDTQYKGVVVYCGSRFMLWKSKDIEYYGADGGFDLDWTVAQDDEFEVIGNIFDNPELLDQ